MLLDTGARQGEVLNLRGGDVGQDAQVVTFRSRPGSKSRGRERHVPVSPEFAALLRMLAALSGGGPLFPYRRTTVRELWEEICGRQDSQGGRYCWQGRRDPPVPALVPAPRSYRFPWHSAKPLDSKHCERGGTGRRAGLRILSRKGSGFDSRRSHSRT
jgi:hypothetical protein